MIHINSGSESHNNTGYNNHSNSGANGHTNTGYNNHSNYGNHTNYNNYRCYNQSGGYTQSGYNNHTNTGYSNHSNSNYNNHTNTGYTNHIDTIQNIEPDAPTNVRDTSGSYYYKTTARVQWNAIGNIGLPISAISGSYGTAPSPSSGIYQHNIRKVAGTTGIQIGYWSANGTWIDGRNFNTYAQASEATSAKNFLAGIPNGSYVAISSWDAIVQGSTKESLRAFFNDLISHGFNSTKLNRALEGNRNCIALIFRKGTKPILKEQYVIYGVSPTTAGVCSVTYNISQNSGQTINYILESNYKTVTGSYRGWQYVATTTSTYYDVSLSNFGNGFVQFRVKSNDGMETSAYAYSREIRVLKYTAPSTWQNVAPNVIIKAVHVNEIKNEIEKLNQAVNNASINVSDVQPNQIIRKNDIQVLKDRINNIATELGMSPISDGITPNQTLIRAQHIIDFRNWLKKV